MVGMNLEFTTEQLQLVVIALIHSSSSGGSFEVEHREQYNELIHVFVELNSMCRKENDYRLSVQAYS